MSALLYVQYTPTFNFMGRRVTALRSGVTRHPTAEKPRGLARSQAELFDTCQIGVVLRTVLLVQATVAVVTLFTAHGAVDWFLRMAVVTGGALPGTLLWLLSVCALKKAIGKSRPGWQYAAAAALGSGAALCGCGLLRLNGLISEEANAYTAPWSASALAGAMLALLVTTALASRARAQTPAALAARIAELQARIRPHFLFNTLNSAIALVREEPAKAEALLEDLSELFRQALAEPGDSVFLADEIALAQHYLAIEQVRFGDRLRVRWTIDAAANSARLPPLLLQPLVENAVKHGVEPSAEGANLHIRTERRGGTVMLEVVNSLPPLRWAQKPLAHGHGIALDNVRERLRLMHDLQVQFRAGIVDDCYRVRIDIPAGTP